MSPSELEEYFGQEPVPPMRLTLSSGDQLVVSEEDRPIMHGFSLVLRGRMMGRSEAGVRVISIPNIALLERLASRPPRHRARRL
jgi:hypothetical protein